MDNCNVDQMHQVWEVEQEILDVFHTICVNNNLRYSLAYGTLIGAVRHEGFIPWDDDIDVMMPRGDYNKLLAIWEEVAPEGYILQNSNTNSDYAQSFSKILKDHTTFLQEEDERTKTYHKGFFIDIFPGDRVAPKGVSQKIQYFLAAVSLLLTRNHDSGSKGIMRIIEHILLRLPHSMKCIIRDSANKYVQHWENQDAQFFFPCTIRACKKFFPSNLFDDFEKIKFNGKEYLCSSEYDKYLTAQYGDYMQLPPENERIWKHHPIIIDFEHNYEEL